MNLKQLNIRYIKEVHPFLLDYENEKDLSFVNNTGFQFWNLNRVLTINLNIFRRSVFRLLHFLQLD